MAAKYYVSMTDRFFSGWGMARNKINKLVISCETWDAAQAVIRNAERRHEMKYINLTTRKPYYPKDRYFVSYHGSDQGDYESWFVDHTDWR